MRPTAWQRKTALILHLSEKEKLFQDHNKQSDSLKVTKNTLQNWLEGTNYRPRNIANVSSAIAGLVEDRNPSADVGAKEGFLERVGVMELGRLLGFTRAECRREIDQRLSKVMATFNIFNIDNAAAEGVWRELGGAGGGYYLAYRMETCLAAAESTRRPESVMRFPIAVRHLLSGNKAMSLKYRKLRAKAHIFSIAGKYPTYEYDGYITKQDAAGFFHWLFQSRSEGVEDLFYMLTRDVRRIAVHEQDGRRSRLFLIGSLHSRNQDHPAMASAWPLVVERVDLEETLRARFDAAPADRREFDDLDSYFMRTMPGLLDPNEIDPELRRQMIRANDQLRLSLFKFNET